MMRYGRTKLNKCPLPDQGSSERPGRRVRKGRKEKKDLKAFMAAPFSCVCIYTPGRHHERFKSNRDSPAAAQGMALFAQSPTCSHACR